MSALIPDFRTAGIFLLLTALATAISVPARLAADADLPTLEESLAAIGSAKVAYGTGGVARMVGGLTLVAAALPLWRAMRAYFPVAMGAAAAFMIASGIASMVSGATAVALAVAAPTDVIPAELIILPEEEAAFTLRSVAGTLGFTLARTRAGRPGPCPVAYGQSATLLGYCRRGPGRGDAVHLA